MKPSFIVVASGVAGVMAGPVMKRAMTTTTVVETIYTTVTCDDEPTSVSIESFPTWGGPDYGDDYGSITTTSVVQPEPTTTSIPEVVTVTPIPEEPSTTEEYVPETTTEAAATTEAATTTSQSAVPTSGSDMGSIGVYHHNVHRSNHSASSMSWSERHAEYANTIASSCIYDHNMDIGLADYGQNIAFTASTDLSITKEEFLAQSITEMWYNGEVDLFPSDGYGQATPDMTNFHSWGHFSQIIWEGSTMIGCAVVSCDALQIPGGETVTMPSYFSVCNYYPPGNVGGGYADNLNPPAGDATVYA